MIFGTRPEAIKLFPVAQALARRNDVQVVTCVSAQHREMLDQVLGIAGLTPDHDLDLMQADQTLDALTARLLTGIGEVLDTEQPARVIVQGDTATAMAGAMAAYYRKIPVAHVEAGLRSHDIHHPWPEEVNRKVVSGIADLHFAPTELAASTLRAENVDAASIHVTGNTVIDALQLTLARIQTEPALSADWQRLAKRFAGKRIIGVTTHRRENFGDRLADIAAALNVLAQRDDVAIVFPVHLNPVVRRAMHAALGACDNIALIEPLDYPNFVSLLDACDFMLTDSGGVQEEAPALGKPVLVLRNATERQEGVAAGAALLVGTQRERIVAEATRLLDDRDHHAAMAQAHNPFGDGQASERIVKVLAERLE